MANSLIASSGKLAEGIGSLSILLISVVGWQKMQDIVCVIGVVTGVLMVAFTSEPSRGKFEEMPFKADESALVADEV